jgi:hypothetical protein
LAVKSLCNFAILETGILEQPGQKILRKWDEGAARLHPRLEITREGLVLGAGTILAGMARDESSALFLFLDDPQRTMALLATTYERPADMPVCRREASGK